MMGILRDLYHRLPAPPSTNYNPRPSEAPDPFAGLPEDAVVYDVGAKRVREYDRWRLPEGARITRIDIDSTTEPDIVADAHDLYMLPDASADCVVCVCVLEHCRNPHQVVAELFRILKPGGCLFLGVPFLFPYHADPHDHWRITYTGIEHLCQRFEKIGSGFDRGPASCMAELNARYLAILFSFNSTTLYGFLLDLFKWALFWTKYLDRFTIRHPMRHIIHAGVWFFGRKPEEPAEDKAKPKR